MLLARMLLAAVVAQTAQPAPAPVIPFRPTPPRPTSTGRPQPPPAPTDCSQPASDLPAVALASVCAAEQSWRAALAAPPGSDDRRKQLEAAVDQYRSASSMTPAEQVKILSLDRLATLFDDLLLNEPLQMELALRELINFIPSELNPRFRLAGLQERQGQIDAAEETLLSARRLRPDDIEPYRMLAQFYARRATKIYDDARKEKATLFPPPPPLPPGTPDENGVYHIGGNIPPPTKSRDVPPVYPREAQIAGIQGIVIVEVIIGEDGRVSLSDILRSIPYLDEAALQAVRQWRYSPSIIDGRPARVKLTTTANFTVRDPDATPTPTPTAGP